MKILLINGSSQDPSLNERYLQTCYRLLKKLSDFDYELANLRTLGLPLFIGYESSDNRQVEHWRDLVTSADGYVIASPEYHHALPALLKNAFEHLDEDEMRGKVAMLIGASTGQFGTVVAQQSLYPILRTFGVWLYPDELFIPRAQKIIDAEGNVTDQILADRLQGVLSSFVESVKVMSVLRERHRVTTVDKDGQKPR